MNRNLTNVYGTLTNETIFVGQKTNAQPRGKRINDMMSYAVADIINAVREHTCDAHLCLVIG